jgi:hypothetical protein
MTHLERIRQKAGGACAADEDPEADVVEIRPLGRLSRCRSEACQAPIVWCWTEKGKRMAVDAVPVESGGNVIKVGHREGAPVIRVLSQGELSTMLAEEFNGARRTPRYMTHFATCAESERFRR